MLFQTTHICFNGNDYVMLDSVTYIKTENGANVTKIDVTMVFSLSYLVPVRKWLFQIHHVRYCSLVKLLCICVYYLNLPNHG